MRALVIGWASFRHGGATPVDVLGMRRVDAALTLAEVPHDLAWGPSLRAEGLTYEEVDPARYSHVVFVSGAARGGQVREVHRRFAHCHRIAVGVSVTDPGDDAVTGFDQVLARDHQGIATPDLSIDAPTDEVLVAGLILEPEPTAARSHVTRWLTGIDCGRVPLDPGLVSSDWTRCATPDQFTSILSHLDVVVTTRLDGLVLGLRAGVPVLAVDPVDGGGVLTAQADALGWPALVPAEETGRAENLDSWWRWCASVQGRAVAALRALPSGNGLMRDMVKVFEAGPVR